MNFLMQNEHIANVTLNRFINNPIINEIDLVGEGVDHFIKDANLNSYTQ